jgi:rhamnogalacturonyl hydrolase YesR
MGVLTGDRGYFDDAARQVLGMSARLFHDDAGLYDHSWFENAEPADPTFYWGRGAGWMLMSMAELLTLMPADHPDRTKVLDQYLRAVKGVGKVQGGTGLWHQLLDKPDSYLETSVSAMFVFTIARGVNEGWLSPAWAPVAQAGWRAVAQRVRPDGQIEGICVGTTAAYDAVYYYNRPTELGAMQGYGPTLMAGAEVITMLRSFDVEKKLNTFHWRAREKPRAEGFTRRGPTPGSPGVRVGSAFTSRPGRSAVLREHVQQNPRAPGPPSRAERSTAGN